ncbi:MAG: hypothetical protein J6X78_06800 [Treponema sp.]|nr:hypothetical protein [Treponema sp.]
MNLTFSVGFSICIILLCILIILYLYDPKIFLARISGRLLKIKFFLRNHFTKAGKVNKTKFHKLFITIEICESAISKYVNKKNLSTLKDDETLKNLLALYRELLDEQDKPDSELSIEHIQELRDKVNELYFPDTDPYYNYYI